MSLRVLTNCPLKRSPPVPLNPVSKLLCAIEFFNMSPCLPLPQIFCRVGGEPGQTREVCSHAGSHWHAKELEVMAFGAERGSVPINLNCFGCRRQALGDA